MASAIVKAAVVWIVENKGADFEAWIRAELRTDQDPQRRALLKMAAAVVRRARADPEAFADEVGSTYDAVTTLYREYKNRP
jgi:hypothetical protein